MDDTRKLVQTCEWITDHFDLGNEKLALDGMDAQEVTEALFAMNRASRALQLLTQHVYDAIEIVLPPGKSAKKRETTVEAEAASRAR